MPIFHTTYLWGSWKRYGMRDKKDIIERVDELIKKLMNGYVFNMDLQAYRLLEDMKREIIKLRKRKENKKWTGGQNITIG